MALYDGRKGLGQVRRAEAAEYYEKQGILALLLDWAKQGVTQEDQVTLLNNMGHKTYIGHNFTQGGLSRVIKRAQEMRQLPQSVE